MRGDRTNSGAIRVFLYAWMFFICLGACSTSSVNQNDAQQDANDRVVVDYRREGGLLPVATEWKLFDGGRLLHADGKMHKLDREVYSKLWSLCNRIEKDYASSTEHFCADCRIVTLQLDCNEAKRQITVIEGVAGTPQHILDLLSLIHSAIKR